jgi:hypothetical protein
MNENRKKLLGQIILRIDDENGHHIIRKYSDGFSIEGYEKKPDNYLSPPSYFFPFTKECVVEEFKKQGVEFRE